MSTVILTTLAVEFFFLESISLPAQFTYLFYDL